MPRFLLTTFGSLGDLHPYLAIGRELLARGHGVTVLTHEPYRMRVTNAGLAFAPLAPDFDSFPDPVGLMRQAMEEHRGSVFILRALVVPFLREQMNATRAAAEHHDVILSHPVTLMTAHVAEAMHKPWASASLQPATMFSRVDPPYFPNYGMVMRIMRLGPPVANLLYRLMMVASRPMLRECDVLRAELGLPATSRHPLLESVFSPHLHLALFSPVFAPPQSDWPAQTVVTGFPLHDRGEQGEGMSKALNAWLDSGDAPLLFTLGSSAVNDPGSFFTESATAARRLGRRAVLLVGTHPKTREPLTQDAAPRLEDAPTADVVAVAYAPHSEIMPRTAAVVHQCGIGTMAQALRSGRPMLATPFGHDQPDNARHAQRLGVARVVTRRAYRAGPVAHVLERLLSDPAIAAAAATVGGKIRAEDGAAAAADALERLAARH
ncbi:MAG: glycosyltransferase [Candidatus Eisenbacteria bacterium]